MAGNTPDAPQNSLPPYPWPQAPTPEAWQPCEPGPPLCVGGFGTVWKFKLSALQARAVALGANSDLVETVLTAMAWADHLVQQWAPPTTVCEVEGTESDPDPTIAWVSPVRESMANIQMVQAQVQATLGQYERLSHVFHLAKKGSYAGASDAAMLQTMADKIKTAFVTWLASVENVASDATATSARFTSALTYSSVTCSLVTYHDDDKPYGDNKPDIDIGGQVSAFTTGNVGTGSGSALPYEVAMCLTLKTDTPGKSTRGRLYLGGFASSVLAANNQGVFTTVDARTVAGRFGTSVINAIHTDSAAGYEFNVLSRKHATARGIGGIAVGVVPDSQRRRRFSIPENRYVAWGT